jgi:4-amino-4-deoxy-L-arabinose transferase-like glycosyltransferase
MPKIVKAFIQIYFCIVIALFLWNSINAIRFTYGIDYGESPLMDQARRLINREPLYKSSFNSPPYVIANYPPMYPSLIAFSRVVFHSPLFQTGRVISFAFSILSGYLIGLFAFNLTRNKWLGLFCVALFLGQPYVVFWSSLARVDMMALGLSLLGLWVLYRYRDNPKTIVLAAFIFLLSIFTRQTYLLAGPLAGFIWLWHINRKSSGLFLALLFTSGMLIFGTITALTHGGFYTNIVSSNINQFNFMHILSATKQYFFIWPLVILTSLIVMAFTIYIKFSIHFDNRFEVLHQPFIFYGLIFYTLGATISAMTIGKIGSNVNYFLELIAALSIWFGIGWKIILEQKHIIQWIFLGFLVIQAVWASTNSLALIQQNTRRLDDKQIIDKSLNQRINQAVDSGTVISDDFMDLIVLSGQPIYYQPFEYGELYLAGLWDPTAFVEQINRQEFSLVIVGGNTLDKDCCWPPPVIAAFESNYQIENENNMLILMPLK